MEFLTDDIYYVEVMGFDQSVHIRHFWNQESATLFAEQSESEGCYWARIYHLDSTFADGSIQCLEVEREQQPG